MEFLGFRASNGKMHFFLNLFFVCICSIAVNATACNQDNCYRALSNAANPASFCVPFTAQIYTSTAIPAYLSQCSSSMSRISSACSCVVSTTTTATTTTTTSACSAPTVTVTVPTISYITIVSYSSYTSTATAIATTIETVTSTTTLSPASACTNYGVEWAAYSYDVNVYGCSPLEPELYKSQTPELTGIADTYSFFSDGGSYPIFGSTTSVDTALIVVDFRGYFLADEGGPYTFTANYFDNFLSLWVGDFALEGWTADNANLVLSLSTNNPTTYTVNLAPGIYPIRYMWENCGGPGTMGFTITAPDGAQIVNENSVNSPYFVTSCPEVGAYEYPPWGSES